MSKVFVCYSRHNEAIVHALARDIEKLGHHLWFDRELSGGQAWWDQILGQIRESEVFVAALSPEALKSIACKSERRYAQALGKLILPVVVVEGIDPKLLPPALSKLQLVMYQEDRYDSALELARAINAAPPSPPPPDPLPAAPEVPISYLGGLKAELETAKQLGFEEQSALLLRILASLRDPDAVENARQLLKSFRTRRDLFAQIADQADEVLRKVSNESAGGGPLESDLVAEVSSGKHSDEIGPAYPSSEPQPPPQSEREPEASAETTPSLSASIVAALKSRRVAQGAVATAVGVGALLFLLVRSESPTEGQIAGDTKELTNSPAALAQGFPTVDTSGRETRETDADQEIAREQAAPEAPKRTSSRGVPKRAGGKTKGSPEEPMRSQGEIAEQNERAQSSEQLVVTPVTPPTGGGRIKVQRKMDGAHSGKIPRAVRDECRGFGSILPSSLARQNDDVVLVESLQGQGGKTLALEITYVKAKGGGMFSGPKKMEVAGKLHQGRRVLGSFTAYRGSLKGQTCKSLLRVEQALARDISRWLQSPSMHDKLGAAQ